MLAFCVSFNFVSQWQLISVLCLQSWKNGKLLSCDNTSLFILWQTLFSSIKCSSRMQYDAPSFGGRKENEENNGDSFITTVRTYGSKPTSFYSVYRRNFSNTTEEDQLVRAPDTQALTSPPCDVLL